MSFIQNRVLFNDKNNFAKKNCEIFILCVVVVTFIKYFFLTAIWNVFFVILYDIYNYINRERVRKNRTDIPAKLILNWAPFNFQFIRCNFFVFECIYVRTYNIKIKFKFLFCIYTGPVGFSDYCQMIFRINIFFDCLGFTGR